MLYTVFCVPQLQLYRSSSFSSFRAEVRGTSIVHILRNTTTHKRSTVSDPCPTPWSRPQTPYHTDHYREYKDEAQSSFCRRIWLLSHQVGQASSTQREESLRERKGKHHSDFLIAEFMTEAVLELNRTTREKWWASFQKQSNVQTECALSSLIATLQYCILYLSYSISILYYTIALRQSIYSMHC